PLLPRDPRNPRRVSQREPVQLFSLPRSSSRAALLARQRLRRKAGAAWHCAGAEQRLADILVVDVAGLNLLRDGVHVAKAALEFVGAEHGGGAGHVIGSVDHGGG